MGRQFRNIVYLADRSGTGKWRKIWPQQSLDCIAHNYDLQLDYSQTPILDQSFYRDMTSVTVQRWLTDQQRDIFCKLIQPVMDLNCGWTVYEIDDLMFDGTFLGTEEEQLQLQQKYGDLVRMSIPRFNRGRAAFEGKQIQSNIRQILNSADFVTVTTDYLKHVYHDIYGIPLENIIAVPNLLPKYLFGDRYDLTKKVEQFKRNKAKPRIGIVSSLSHYNIDHVREDKDGRSVRKVSRPDGTEIWVNEQKQEVPFTDTREITDDIDAIIDCIRETVNDIQWVFFGYCPEKLNDLVQRGKIEVHGGEQIMNYASKLDKLELQAVVAAINPIGFNFCKSFIKTMECAALGIPCLATACLPYSRVMPNEQLFKTGADLKDRLMKLKWSSPGAYQKTVERQWKWLNSPCVEGDFHLRNFWLEDNLNIYLDLYRLRQKTMQVSFDLFVKQYDEKQQREKENTIFKNDKILITK